MSAGHAFTSLRDFYAHALAIEHEASNRYQRLAQQMIRHNNMAVAETFERLARLESDHAARIQRAAPDVDISTIPAWEYQWEGWESPESTSLQVPHYLMTPYHALRIAVRNEERAIEFFESVAGSTPSRQIRDLAEQCASDERMHLELIRHALAAVERPGAGFDHDLDPPREED